MNHHMTPEEVAERFQVSRRLVMNRVRSGEFPHIRIGNQIRFTQAHVEQIEKVHEVRPAAAPANAWGRRTRRSA